MHDFLVINFRAWDCETCTKDVLALTGIMSSDQGAVDSVNYLNGPALCQDPALNLGAGQVAMCQEFLAAFLPPALKVYFDVSESSAGNICKYTYDVC